MSDKLLCAADSWRDGGLTPRHFSANDITAISGLITRLADRVRELEAERLTHGNIMGRIAIALFSDQNNRTDEECVAAVAELSYERSGAIQRAKRAEAERNTLRALLREARLAYWIEIDRNTIPTDPPDELLERLNAVLGDKPWDAALGEKP